MCEDDKPAITSIFACSSGSSSIFAASGSSSNIFGAASSGSSTLLGKEAPVSLSSQMGAAQQIVSASRHPPTPLEPKIVKCVVSWSPQLEVSTNKQTGDEGVRSKGEKGSGEKGVRR